MSSGILWHNASTGEIQIWFLDKNRLISRASVIAGDGTAAAIGEPFRIVAATDANADRNASIIWHHDGTNETQMWFLDREWFTDRSTVVGEEGEPAFIGPPFGIVGAGDFDGTGTADILWYNTDTGESQIWFMDRHRLTDRASVLGEDGQQALIGPPFHIVGVGDFDRVGRVRSPVMNFTFDSTITPVNRDRLIARHLFALARAQGCGNLAAPERSALIAAYGKRIHHTTSSDPDVNASAFVGGDRISVNFTNLFPDGDEEISQTLIHEMMHCAGFTHPTRRDPPMGQLRDCTKHDCPNDNGPYYGTSPLRAEFCIAGDQSDLDLMARIESKTLSDRCTVGPDGLAIIHQSDTA